MTLAATRSLPRQPNRPTKRALFFGLVAACSSASLVFAAASRESAPGTTNRIDLHSNLVVAQPESVGFSTERLKRVHDRLQEYINDRKVAGTVGLIARNGQIVYLEALGHRDAESGAPMTTDTIFRIASMTKPIASVALMQLWEQGRFQLREPISKALPEFAQPSVATLPGPGEYVAVPFVAAPAKNAITYQHLLTHTAGLPNTYRGITQPMFQALGSKRLPEWTVGDYVAALADLPLNFEPGSQWEYGPATDVVGRLVEVLSGEDLDTYLRRHIFEPLGMKDTHFYLPESKVSRFAALYRPDADGRIELAEAPDSQSRWVKEPHKYFSGAGGLVSTAADYFRFQQMMLNGGELSGQRILGRKTVELMTNNHIGDLLTWLRGPGYGFGLGYSVVKDQGQTGMPASPGSFAWGGAFCTVFWVDPVEEIVGILMTQVRPYTHLNIRQDFETLTYQALVD